MSACPPAIGDTVEIVGTVQECLRSLPRYLLYTLERSVPAMLDVGSKGFISAHPIRFAGSLRMPEGGCRSYPSGKCVYHQGDDACYAYQVLSGLLRISRVLETGRRQVLAFALSGDTVGLPERGLHMGTCDVLEDAELRPVRLSSGSSASRSKVQDWLLDVSLGEVARLNDLSFSIGALSSTQRLASLLARLMTRVGRCDGPRVFFRLSMLREDVADHLGMKVETVSRSFSDLRNRGLLALPEPSYVIVLDPAGLLRVAVGDD
jgi:CRP-like cAMP-binding protein